jgi:flagellar biosynthesis protein FliQ
MTQIQEMTLTFVPKLITLFVTMVIFMPFMLATMIKFTEFIFDKIIAGGGA